MLTPWIMWAEATVAFIALVVLIWRPRWWLLALATAVFLGVAAGHAWSDAGAMRSTALAGAAFVLAPAFAAVGAVAVGMRKYFLKQRSIAER